MRRFGLTLHFCLVLVSTLLIHAQTFTTLASFDGSNGYTPSGALIQADDGNFYGLTAEGGEFGSGVVFKASTSGALSAYQGFPINDGTPSGRLLQAGGMFGNNFVGLTHGGGNGIFFEAGPSFLTPYFSFCQTCEGYGSQPYAGLIQAPDGNLYFTTSAGGELNACSGGCGTVAQMSPGLDPNYFHIFNGSDGANPRGELLQASDGNLYGTTVNGGNNNCQDGCGTIFKITPGGAFTSLYKFCSQSNCPDGANPYSALVQGADGALYGTTSAGANLGVTCSFNGCGTIFKITLDGTLTTLYSFCADFFCPTGANPQSGLIQASDGNFYGAASSGGDATLGTLFRITPQGKLSLLHTFVSDDGAYPTSALLQANDGNFYGVTTQGGTAYGGTLFRMVIDFNATLSATKSGNGTVTSDDAKIQCGGVCSANYESGDVVMLTATPDQHWGFASWTGCDGVQANVCTVTMNHARSVAATFVPAYALSVSTMGNGTVTSNDGFINCGQMCSHTYLVYSPVILTAFADGGWVLAGWSGCDRSDGIVCSVSMNNARNVSATFKPLYPLAVSNAGNGLVIGNGGIYCGSACYANYADSSTVTLTGIPNPAYTVSWSGCDNVQGNVCTIIMSGARNATASFAQNVVILSSLVLQPSTVRGGNLSSATVTLSGPAPPGGVGIAISTDHPEAVHPPSQVVVPGGKRSVSFAVRTFTVHAETLADLTASAGSSHVSATLTVEPPGWRGPKTLAGNGSDTDAEATMAESDPAGEFGSSGGRSPSPEHDKGSPKTAALRPPPADPADERKEYPVRFIGAVNPVGTYNGDLRDLPHIPSKESPERELVQPVDLVHKVFPAVPPPNTLMASVGPMPQPSISFAGMNYDFYGEGHPPDPTGAVGQQYYIQAINKTYAVFDKGTGALVVSFNEESFWFGGDNSYCAYNSNGDPIVLYDQTADRWIVTNLAYGDYNFGPFYQCIAVSQSGDPRLGGWNFYAIQTDQNPVPTGTLNDYPKFGIWNDGCLYMGADGYTPDADYNGQVVLSMSLVDMYGGNPVRYSLSFLSGSANFALFPATMLGKGANLPPPSEAEYYVQESETSDAFNVRTISPGSCISGGTLGAAVAVPHDTYNSFPYDIVPQPPPAGSDNYLDTISNVVMQWVQYRKVGTSESLWVSHTTYVTLANTSPQWAQIDVTGGNINTNLVQQQIYRPDGGLFRWLSSLAVDSSGDMAMCYSTSNANAPNYPSMQCAGRLATDPLGQLPQGETEYIAGAGSQLFKCGGAPCHRWGDYSSTTIDPVDDCTFWHTNMFYPDQSSGNSGSYSTQIVAFRYPNCVTPSATLTVQNSGSGTITSNDGYINCGSTCSHEYQVYTQVILTATAAPGWVFSGWSGCDQVQYDGTCSVTLLADHSVTATFTQGQYALFVSDIGTGSGTIVSTDGYINCGFTCWYGYLGGTVVFLTETPGQGSRFDGWTGCDKVQDNVCIVTILASQYVSGTFNLRPEHFRLSVQKRGSGVGTVTSSDGHISCGSACSFDYNVGDSVTLTAQLEHGSILKGWSGCDQVQNGTCSVKMSEVRSVTAEIDVATYLLAVDKSGSGTISSGDGHVNCGPTCSYGYPAWTKVVLTAVPGPGWATTGWTGCDQSNGDTCSVSMYNARNVSATFKVLYQLAVSNSGNGLVIGNGGIYCGSSCAASYAEGSTATLTAIPNPGYTVAWSGCNNVQGNICTVAISGARNVTATFTQDQVTLTSLTFKPTYVKGGQLSAGTLTLNAPAPPGGVTVALSSDHPSVAHPPSFVFVPGGKNSVGFAVNTFAVKSNTTVSITATAGGSQVSGTLMVGTPSLR